MQPSPPWPETHSKDEFGASDFTDSEIQTCLDMNLWAFKILKFKSLGLRDIIRGFAADESKEEVRPSFDTIVMERKTAYIKAAPYVGDLNWVEPIYFWDYWTNEKYDLFIAGPAKLEWRKRDRPIYSQREYREIVNRDRRAAGRGELRIMDY